MGLGEDGSPGPHLPSLAVGTSVEIDGPIGTFLYPDRLTEPAVLFVAGGSGIAPLRAMLHEALGAPEAPEVSVLYSARTAEEFAFDDELTGLAGQGRIRYEKTATRETRRMWQGKPRPHQPRAAGSRRGQARRHALLRVRTRSAGARSAPNARRNRRNARPHPRRGVGRAADGDA